jgi:hypothetical protein
MPAYRGSSATPSFTKPTPKHSPNTSAATPSKEPASSSEPGSIDHVLFVPSKQKLDVYETPAAGGKKIVVHYAGDRSQAQIQNNGVTDP